MTGIYFSGTDNTKYCIERFLAVFDGTAKILSIEDAAATGAIAGQREIVLAYPVYYSNLPKIVRDFIMENRCFWKNKRVFIIATMGLFSGDGAGLAARLLKKYDAQIIGGLHIKMPDCICDVKALKRSLQENRQILQKANEKIETAATNLKNKIPPKDGLRFWSHTAGLLGQRLWFYRKTLRYSDKLKIDVTGCISCGKCVSLCPMKNLSIVHGQVTAGSRCTMCYRCISQCPQQAITLLGNTIYAQHHVSQFL